MASLWRQWGTAHLKRRRTEFGLTLRITVASLLSLAIAQALHLRLPLWAVLTAVIVTQMSVGRSLKATGDYLIGTLGGALYGGLLAIFIPHSSEWELLAVLALAIAPTTFVAAIRPGLNSAPVTAIIVLLVPLMAHVAPIDSAIDRVLEVAVGALTGLAVSVVVLPSRAHRLARTAGARALNRMAVALDQLLNSLTSGFDTNTLHGLQDGIGEALVALNAVAGEAERERRAHVWSGPQTGPLLRTLLRLRHDMVIVGRAATSPPPTPVLLRFAPPIKSLREACVAYLRGCAVALLARSAPPSRADVKAALAAYATEVAAARADGMTRGLPGDAAERFFALGFAIDQMVRDLRDLEQVIASWAEPAGVVDEPHPDQT